MDISTNYERLPVSSTDPLNFSDYEDIKIEYVTVSPFDDVRDILIEYGILSKDTGKSIVDLDSENIKRVTTIISELSTKSQEAFETSNDVDFVKSLLKIIHHSFQVLIVGRYPFQEVWNSYCEFVKYNSFPTLEEEEEFQNTIKEILKKHGE
jgi:hypothetical protein